MTRRNLILVYPGPNYKRDFDEIAIKIHARDRTIAIYYLPAGLRAELPEDAWQHPTLTVSLVPRFQLKIKRGRILGNYPIEKLVQQEIFRKHRIPTPPALPFRFGMALDPVVFGEFVILKPIDLRFTSGSHSVFPFKRDQLENIGLDQLPAHHPVRMNPKSYMVQRFIYTGPHPRHLRIQTFFGRTIFCFESRVTKEEPFFDFDMQSLKHVVITTSSGERSRELVRDEEAMRLAEDAHAGFKDIPSLGFDIVRDYYTNQLYVLECNAGGNTWHFSSEIGRVAREHLGGSAGVPVDRSEEGRKAMIAQLGAFDIVAEALIAKVAEMAS
jgi:hypothetical protein